MAEIMVTARDIFPYEQATPVTKYAYRGWGLHHFGFFLGFSRSRMIPMVVGDEEFSNYSNEKHKQYCRWYAL